MQIYEDMCSWMENQSNWNWSGCEKGVWVRLKEHIPFTEFYKKKTSYV